MPAHRPQFLESAELCLLLFGGKGGVGKTTCAAAAALHLAGRFPQRSFLLASIDPAHSLLDSLGGTASLANLRCLEMDLRASLAKFKSDHANQLREIALRGTFLDEEDINQLLELSIPGFDELMAFTELAALLESQQYSCIIVDTAPTGHTLRFLELPELMRCWWQALDAMLAKRRYLVELYRGSYRQDDLDLFLEKQTQSLQALAALLRDADRCQFIPVMLAEPLSTLETRRLLTHLLQRQVAVRDLLVNRLYPAESSCPTCRETHRRQQQELGRTAAAFSRFTLWGIPQQGGEVRGCQCLAHFWDQMEPLGRLEREKPAAPPPSEQAEQAEQADRPAPLPAAGVRLLLLAGKGGVGKTTLACATAARLAREYPDQEVLLFSTDPAHSLSDCLKVSVGPQECRLGPGLTALEIDADAEFAGIKELYASEVDRFFSAVLEGASADLEFDRQAVERLLDLSPPGLDEVMGLLRAMELMETGKYAIFVLDTAPTGHLVRLLEMPELMQDWLKTLFDLFLKYKHIFRLPRLTEFLVGLSKKVKLLRCWLADADKGQLYVVSLLTEMAYAETCDLIAACRHAQLHVPAIFLNLVTPSSACPLCQEVVAMESRVRTRFAETFPDIPQTLVYRWTEPRGLDRLSQFGLALWQKKTDIAHFPR